MADRPSPHTLPAAAPLLGPADPTPFILHRAGGTSPFVLIADHAGQAIPAALDDLGLPWREPHDALDKAVMAGLAFIKLRALANA